MHGARIDDIHILRSCAILMVIMNHSWYNNFLPQWMRSGHTGVALFFVISGFLIARSAFSILEKTELSREFSYQFFCRRVSRIIPPAGVWLLAYIAYFTYRNYDWRPEVAAITTFTYNYALKSVPHAFGHYWSLIAEEHFYLLFAATFAVLVKRNWLVWTCVIGIVLVWFVGRPLALDAEHMTHARADSFMLGILLAHMARQQPWKPKSPVVLSILAVVAVLGLVQILGKFYAPRVDGHALLAVVCTVVVWIASLDANVVFPVPVLRQALVFMGERSYSMYLCHPLVVYWDNLLRSTSKLWLQQSVPIRVLISFAVVLLLSEISYQLLERRVGRVLLSWLSSRRPVWFYSQARA